jgi:adenylate cyclase
MVFMLQKTFTHNKKVYSAYNNFRKDIFIGLAPKDGESILYLLPWMLSVNDPAVPGFVANLKRSIAVYGATVFIMKRLLNGRRILSIRSFQVSLHLNNASHS